MQIILLIVIIGCLFWAGYRLSKKMDLFFKKNEMKAAGKEIEEGQIWIGVSFRDWLLPRLFVEHILPQDRLQIKASVGSESVLMRRLSEDEADMLILRKKPSQGLFEGVRYITIEKSELYEQNGKQTKDKVWIVWNEKTESKYRDRLLMILEDKRSVLKTGYCNY